VERLLTPVVTPLIWDTHTSNRSHAKASFEVYDMNQLNTITTRLAPLVAICALSALLSACGAQRAANVTASSQDEGQTLAPVAAPVTVTAQAPAVQTPVSQQAPAPAPTQMLTSAPTPVVQAVPVGRAALSWTPPTENTDGSALSNLAGYRVYYGASAGALTQKVDINNAGLTAYVLENLPAGTTYFAVVAINSAGVESALSGVGSKTI
jgi:hypothetical protein